MKKINWKTVNAAFWIEMGLVYFLPFQATDGFQYQAGFPIPFLTVYDTKPGINPFMSMHLNPVGLLVNGAILYMVIDICIRTYQKYRGSQTL